MPHYIVVSLSARALAASAKRAGYQICSIDCFADLDTQRDVLLSCKLTYHYGGFDEAELLEAVGRMTVECPDTGVVIGSGFEANPNQLEKLAQSMSLISNHPDTIRRLKDPGRLQELLSDNHIPYPATFLSSDKCNEHFLIKRIGGEGGGHVRWLEQAGGKAGLDYYYQEYVEGEAMSAVALADSKGTDIIGFNHQLHTDQFSKSPFLYQGAIGTFDISTPIFDEVKRIVKTIAADTGLRGLFGVDFIKTGADEIVVLEINPRPPAGFELHEHGGSLFAEHIACFETGGAGFTQNRASFHQGYAILYLREDIYIHADIIWPAWVRDRPEAGQEIPAGQPVCSVFVAADTVDMTKMVLHERLREIKSAILMLK